MVAMTVLTMQDGEWRRSERNLHLIRVVAVWSSL